VATLIQGDELRALLLGRGVVSKAIPTLSSATFQLFTITGGEVMITALWAKVTTAITGDTTGTLNLQFDPTTGDTTILVTATDLGTSNTAAGTTLGFLAQGDGTVDYLRGGQALRDWVVSIGDVETIAGVAADGGVTFYCTWIPLTDGAVLTAAA
jgi:hypothetical protein